MAAPALLIDSFNCNDGVTYTIDVSQGAVDLGSTQKTSDEYKSYTGGVIHVNVSTAYSVPMSFPLLVQSDSAADLRAALGALNDAIDSIAPGTSVLTYDTSSYTLMDSPHVDWQENSAFLLKFYAPITLALNRLPD